MKAFSYIRFSSDKQQWGDSERRQEQRAKDWCARKSIPLADIFADRGVSAAKGKNRESGAFASLLKVVKAGDYILIEDNDRFGRDDALTALQALKDICSKGITVVFLSNGIEVNENNFNDPAVIFPNFLHAYLGNQENTKKSKRIGERWALKRKSAANGVIVTRMAPAWLDVVNGSFRINDKAKVVLRVFESYAQGMPIKSIVKALNGDKVAPFGKGAQNRSKSWSSTPVRRLLGSRSVIGEYQPHKFISKSKREIDGQSVTDYYKRIISHELFYKCQGILSRNLRAGGSKTSAANLFTGFIKCAHCGGAMHTKDGSKGKYVYWNLICANARNNAGCVYKNTIQYKHVERAVLSVIWSKVIPAMTEDNARADKLNANQCALKDAELGVKNLMAVIEKIGIDETLVNRLSKLRADKAIYKSEIERLEALAQDNPLLDWTLCEPTIDNRLRLQNVLRGEIENLRIDAAGRKALLTLKDPAVTFELVWDYQRANKVKKNPADIGFTISDKTDGVLDNAYMAYLDELFVWKRDDLDIRIAMS